jgi:hypothetical protein
MGTKRDKKGIWKPIIRMETWETNEYTDEEKRKRK